MGVAPGVAAKKLLEFGADAIGANCGTGPAEMTPVLRQIREAAPGAVVLGQANAGIPKIVGGKVIYDCTADEMAVHAREWLAIGVNSVGSCCGSTPQFTGALRGVLDRHLNEGAGKKANLDSP